MNRMSHSSTNVSIGALLVAGLLLSVTLLMIVYFRREKNTQ
jgi:hypothetical protein